MTIEDKFENYSKGSGVITKKQLKDQHDYMKIIQPEVFARCQMEEEMGVAAPSGGAACDVDAGKSEEEKQKEEAEKKVREQDMASKFFAACGARVPGIEAKPNLSTAQALVSMGVSPDIVDESGWTALHHAAGEGLAKIVKWLCFEVKSTGADTNRSPDWIDAVDGTGCTPLWCACHNGQRDTALPLMAAGADCDIKGTAGEGKSEMTPALVARSSNTGSPGLADAVDAEVRLRTKDPSRMEQLRARTIVQEDFKLSLKAELAEAGCET